ncbi:protein of unknown function [Streptomyces sp. KY75]|nr:protein of unknown function [Streptomyces sp. KY75]
MPENGPRTFPVRSPCPPYDPQAPYLRPRPRCNMARMCRLPWAPRDKTLDDLPTLVRMV